MKIERGMKVRWKFTDTSKKKTTTGTVEGTVVGFRAGGRVEVIDTDGNLHQVQSSWVEVVA